jgi:hypothetical protein
MDAGVEVSERRFPLQLGIEQPAEHVELAPIPGRVAVEKDPDVVLGHALQANYGEREAAVGRLTDMRAAKPLLLVR